MFLCWVWRSSVNTHTFYYINCFPVNYHLIYWSNSFSYLLYWLSTWMKLSLFLSVVIFLFFCWLLFHDIFLCHRLQSFFPFIWLSKDEGIPLFHYHLWFHWLYNVLYEIVFRCSSSINFLYLSYWRIYCFYFSSFITQLFKVSLLHNSSE